MNILFSILTTIYMMCRIRLETCLKCYVQERNPITFRLLSERFP